jgi:hypothetical protein
MIAAVASEELTMSDAKNLPSDTKRQPINMRKKPRLIIIQPSTKVTKILVTPDADKTRMWFELPSDADMMRPEEAVDSDS